MYLPFRRTSWKRYLGLGLVLLGSSEAYANALTNLVHKVFPPQQASPSSSSGQHLTFHSGYAQLPMAFEANEGQTDSRVRFIARGNVYMLYITDSETVLSLNLYDKNDLNPKNRLKGQKHSPKISGQDILRLSLTGASNGISFEAQNPLPGVSSYFIGKDSSQWRTHIQQYSQVVEHEVYPGIDMVYYGKQGQMEYDFHVKPGADPKMIRIQHAGADSAVLDSLGNLQLSIGNRSVKFKPPTVYQREGGVITSVSGKYMMTGANEIGFELGEYDTPAEDCLEDGYVLWPAGCVEYRLQQTLHGRDLGG